MRAEAVVIRGPVGVGKSSTATAVHELLKKADVPHGAMDLDWLAAGWPHLDKWNNTMRARNAGLMAESYRSVGARVFVLAGVIESRGELDGLRAALRVPELLLCRLDAPLSVIETRLRRRDSGDVLDWHIHRAGVLIAQMAADGLDDFVVDVSDCSLEEAAARIGSEMGWVKEDHGNPG